MAYRRQRSGVDHLAREAAYEILAHPSRQREAVDDHRAILVEYGHEVAGQARRMNWTVARELLRLVGDLLLEIRAHFGEFLGPRRVASLRHAALEFLHSVDHPTPPHLR